MIPKVIHYCWFGHNPIPKEYYSYMQSWQEKCPDYKIQRWDESNFDVAQNLYCKQAYARKKWAFVSDYARLKIIYEHGGIYLDTDVEVVKDLSPLIASGNGFIGFQNSEEATTGLGFAAEAKNPCIKAMLDIYEKRKFILDDGSLNLTPCPAANTVGLMKVGLRIGKNSSKLLQYLDGLTVYPEEYFNPVNSDTKKLNLTANTYTIHWYSASWFDQSAKKKQFLKKLIPNFILSYRSNRIARNDIDKIRREVSYKEP